MEHERRLDKSGETKDGDFMTSVVCLTHNEKECNYFSGKIEKKAVDDNLDTVFKTK